jgi:hypothetical protein
MSSFANHTPADLLQTIAWAALTAVLLGYAIAEGTVGALVLGAATLVLTWHAWTHSAAQDTDEPRFAPQQLA